MQRLEWPCLPFVGLCFSVEPSGTRLVFPTQSRLLLPHRKFAGWGSEGSRDLPARAPRVTCASSMNRLFFGAGQGMRRVPSHLMETERGSESNSH